MTDNWKVEQGDCRDIMRTLPDNSVDATDILGVPGAGRAVLALRRQRVVRVSFSAQPATARTS